MNSIENIKKNNVKDGVKTKDGILYPVKNGEALEIWLHQVDKPFAKVATVEHLTNANQIGVIAYNDVYNENSEPQIVLLDTENASDETVVVFSYVVHEIEVKNGKVISEYINYYDEKEDAVNQFVTDVIGEKSSIYYDNIPNVVYEEYDTSWLAYINGKKDTDYRSIFIEEIPALVRMVK
ncbi:MAG: hypothetical protein K2H01_07985 [Ruminococcus sp.]|nr:hypothetical protein [Ruminococcus sp.]